MLPSDKENQSVTTKVSKLEECALKTFLKKSKKGIDKLKKVCYNINVRKRGRQELPKS